MLVEIGASYLGACQILFPVLEATAVEFQGRIQLMRLDAYRNPSTPRNYGVHSLPTLLYIDKGVVREHITGMVSKQSLIETLTNLLAPQEA